MVGKMVQLHSPGKSKYEKEANSQALIPIYYLKSDIKIYDNQVVKELKCIVGEDDMSFG
jgi:hypothetical protein